MKPLKWGYRAPFREHKVSATCLEVAVPHYSHVLSKEEGIWRDERAVNELIRLELWQLQSPLEVGLVYELRAVEVL